MGTMSSKLVCIGLLANKFFYIAQSAGTAENTNCFSAEE